MSDPVKCILTHPDLAATLSFNPLTYALIDTLGWRMTYAVYAGLALTLGALAALAFRPHSPEELALQLSSLSSAPLQSSAQGVASLYKGGSDRR